MILGLSGFALAKLGGIAACSTGAYWTYRSMPVPSVRAKMLRLFQEGDICLRRKTTKGKEVKRYPSIDRVSILDDYIRVSFSIPNGLDPHLIHKHKWLFAQHFGEKIEIEGESKYFIFTVRKLELKPFDYNYESLQSVIKGMKLPIYVGQSQDGHIAYDMTEYPHLLIAGETGSGKSTELRSIITTLIKTFTADKLHLYMADLKRSEFHLFKRVEHVKKVVVEQSEMRLMLKRLRKEMQRRGDLLDQAEVTHIIDLLEKERPPFIILCVDELALLKKEKECMEIIEEISAIGRALGVFLILSMQRPDADVLDGKLKINLTVRMAFRHPDGTNSRITLDSDDASYIKQKDKGRMYLKLDGLKLVQGPHLDLEVAKKLLEPYKTLKKHEGDKSDIIDVEHEVVEDRVLGVLEDATA